jgi:hypothetical protein
MLDQILELSRKAAESSLQMQQVMFKHLTQAVSSPGAAGISADWPGTIQKRLGEFTIDTLNKQRAALDSTYRVGIQAIEQVSRLSEVKSTEDGVHAAEDVWRKAFDAMKGQVETQLHDLQSFAEKSFQAVRANKANV